MGLFLNSGAISQFQDPVKNLDRENFRHNNFYGQKFPAKKILSAEKTGDKSLDRKNFR